MITVTDNYRIKFGSNTFIDCGELAVSLGESLFRFKRRDEDGILLIDFDLYDAGGEKIATVKNGSIIGHKEGDYTVTRTHHRYTMTEKATGRVVCDIQTGGSAAENAEIELNVDLYTEKGVHLEATPEGINLGGIKMSGNTFQGFATGIVIH